MANTDTIELLRECDAGTKMAVSAIDEVLDKTHDSRLKSLLRENKARHETLGNAMHHQLLEYGQEDKEPSPMAQGMSWLKTNVKLGMNENDATVAELITDGCSMGVKSLSQYLNQYTRAEAGAKALCQELIALEVQLGEQLRDFL